MDWVMIVLVLSTAPNYSQSQSHYLAGFGNEKLCRDAAAAFQADLARPSDAGFKIDVRAVCSQKK
ncbi:hypothetical protein JQ609_01040 [Bradyrhizobium sp. AUGA SZCCT0169]|uniref:hypothetical protein n=1 Tax=Bradyrhizobium sp. AUGA SZCCT0169 TaxID=2807663 RepID=UPI001BA720AE|nr:hypothetical protein [Bradyrhizobium sp. AUGA SZCCT0169]MBR1245508.1 hypothetical protein [Bradyrhizobium sp. AUGA SZCCT0169]